MMKWGRNNMFSKTNKSILVMMMLAMFINFSLLGSVKVYAAPWKSVKDAGFSASVAYYTSIAVDKDGTPYIAYQDADNNNRVTVKKYDGNDWITVGEESVSASTANYVSIAMDGYGTPYVVYMDGETNNKVTVKKYGGSNWTTVGEAGFSSSAAYYTSIAIDKDGIPYVIYKDDGNMGKSTVKKYDGSKWITVGKSGFSESSANYTTIKIDKDGIPYVVYQDGGNSGRTTVKKYDGSRWVTVGDEGFSENYAYYTSMAIDEDGTLYVIYKDDGNDGKATVKKYDGSGWTTVGDEGFSEGIVNYTSIEIDKNGIPYVAYMDGGNNNKSTVKKYDGSDWITIENEGFSASTAYYTAMAIDKDGAAYIAYMDGGNGNKATVMKYSASTEVYKVELSQTETYIFEEQVEGYTSTTPASIIITKAGSGHITNLNAVLNGENADNFTLGELSSLTLDNNTIASTFTIQPRNNLSAGTYVATVTITSNENISESFDISFTVIPETSNDVELPVQEGIIGEDETLPSEIEQEKEKNKIEVTTPAAVIIKGTEKAGNTLEVKLLSEDGTKINTYSGITYKWLRLSSEESEDGELVGEDVDYKLVDSDEGKYIKLEVSYDGYVFKDIISKIVRKSSVDSSSSLKNNQLLVV